MKPLRSVEQKRLHRTWQRRTDQRLALLLDAVQDPLNVGAIVRTAAAFRARHLYLSSKATAPDHPKAGKTALGTERYLSWSRHDHMAEATDEARRHGFAVVGLELAGGAAPLFEVDLSRDVCLAVGNEIRGLTSTALAYCDAVGYVPLIGRVGSLNVATAAALGLYEARRQAWHAR